MILLVSGLVDTDVVIGAEKSKIELRVIQKKIATNVPSSDSDLFIQSISSMFSEVDQQLKFALAAHWRLAGGIILFMRAYTTHCP